jgi:hypothetical protein
MDPPALIADDLAPGDVRARDFDWSGLRLERIRDPDHPLFRAVYQRLWREFGGRGEMEKESVIASRLGWDPGRPINHHALRYEMLAVRRGDDIVAVRDHTAIVPGVPHRADHPGQVFVHLSHVIVEPPLRGSGLAAWLRALPIQSARECARAAGEPARDRITLVAEMEHPDGMTPTVTGRLRSYERAGFLKIDPDAVRYCQPDVRTADEIDRTSVQPVPLALIVRQVGREAETSISGAAVRHLAAALYTMFGVHVRPDHLAPLWALLEHFPGPGERVALRRPSE